ncbi:biotin/lipoate A/B protein ligase family protein [Bacillus sp. JJ664]
MSKTKWYFINSGKKSGSYNMALDECLIKWQSEEGFLPTLRFYEWEHPTVTIGYFQKNQEISLEQLKKYNGDFVRRQTGGRSVLHHEELTYSVIVPENYPNMPVTVTEAYKVISMGILEGFKLLGLDASFAVPKTAAEKDELKKPSSAVCFDAPSWYEVVVNDKKIAGSAQTRQKGSILQHGSIPLNIDVTMLYDLYIFSSEEVRNRMKKRFLERATWINAESDTPKSMDELYIAFKEGFEIGLDIELVPYELTEDQEKEVQALVESKYSTEEWNLRK